MSVDDSHPKRKSSTIEPPREFCPQCKGGRRDFLDRCRHTVPLHQSLLRRSGTVCSKSSLLFSHNLAVEKFDVKVRESSINFVFSNFHDWVSSSIRGKRNQPEDHERMKARKNAVTLCECFGSTKLWYRRGAIFFALPEIYCVTSLGSL